MIFPIKFVSTTPEVPMQMSQLESVEAAWEQMADQREADIYAGRAHWIDGDVAMTGLRERLTSLTKAG